MSETNPTVRRTNLSVYRFTFAGGCTKGQPEKIGELLVVPTETAAAGKTALCQIGFYTDVLDQSVVAVGTNVVLGTQLFDDGAGAVSNTKSDNFYGWALGLITAGNTESIDVLRAMSTPDPTLSQAEFDALANTSGAKILFSTTAQKGKLLVMAEQAVTGTHDLDLSATFSAIDLVLVSLKGDAALGVTNGVVIAEPGAVAGHVDISSQMVTTKDDCTLIDSVNAITVTLLVIGDAA